MRWTLVLLALLPACEAAQGVDDRLRRIDLLDRVFEPERFRPPPAPLPAPAPPPAAPEQAPEPVVMQTPEADPAPWFPEPDPVPAPDPATRTQALLRQQPWLSRFWSELTRAQQTRVARRLPRDSAARWDGMGLTDRVTLLYGTGG